MCACLLCLSIVGCICFPEQLYTLWSCPLLHTPSNLFRTQVLHVLLMLMPRSLITLTLFLHLQPRSTDITAECICWDREYRKFALSYQTPPWHPSMGSASSHSMEVAGKKRGSPAHRGRVLHRCSKGEEWIEMRNELKLPPLCKVSLGIHWMTCYIAWRAFCAVCCTVWHGWLHFFGLAKHAGPTKGTAF